MPAKTAPRSRYALAAQGAVLAVVVALAELAPRPGRAVWYVPLLPSPRHAALDWALAHGAALNGVGPMGGLVLTTPPAELGWRAIREGALAIAIPTFLCQPLESRPHG